MSKKDNLKVQIDGLALCQKPERADNWLPNVSNKKQYPPYDHQVRMQDIIENKDRFIAMNTTVTGGGKTFSYAVPVMRSNMTAIVVFPTNALTADQYQSISDLATDYFSDKSVYIREITANNMQNNRENIREKSSDVSPKIMSNSQQIQRSLDKAYKNKGPSFILTNPDIYLGILRGKYGAETRQKLEMSDIIIVDEFHHARPKGQNSLIMSMDEIYHRNDNRCNINKFILLSATPNEDIEEQLSEYFGRPYEDIYYRVDSTDNSRRLSEISLKNSSYNPVMPQVKTTFIGSRPFSTKDKIKSDKYLDKIVNFVESDRSIIILDGVSEVNDVYNIIEDHTKSSTRVEPISGLRSENTSDKLDNSDVIVANSTLEVGVDIGDVQNLVFSGYSASRFLQRLGRLRADSDNIRKSAVCFTQPDTLKTIASLRELETNQISRYMLQETINQCIGSETNSDMYKSWFSPIEMYRAIDERSKTMFESESNYRKKASQIVAKHCFKSTGFQPRKQDIEKMWSQSQSALGKALQSYRQSTLNALVFDERTEKIKSYSIPSILRIADVEFLTEPQFDSRLKDIDINPRLYESEKRYAQTFAWLHRHKSGDKLRDPHIVPNCQIRNILTNKPKNRKPSILKSLEFTVDRTDQIEGLGILNKQLDSFMGVQNGVNIVGYPTEGHPAQIQTVYGLDEYFFTNPIANMNGNYTLALGENAMYLYCYVQENLNIAEKLYKDYR